MKFKSFLIAVFMTICSVQSSAYTLSNYECIIHEMSDDSSIHDSIKKHYINERFYVDRISGRVSGILQNDYVNAPIVIDLGSLNNSFKAVGYLKIHEGAGVGSNLYALNIAEFEEGNNKPFTYMDNSKVFRGLCKHH
ncbi:MAG: hypothetical protein ACN6NX_12720 [Acinetobacter sp.]